MPPGEGGERKCAGIKLGSTGYFFRIDEKSREFGGGIPYGHLSGGISLGGRAPHSGGGAGRVLVLHQPRLSQVWGWRGRGRFNKFRKSKVGTYIRLHQGLE